MLCIKILLEKKKKDMLLDIKITDLIHIGYSDTTDHHLRSSDSVVVSAVATLAAKCSRASHFIPQMLASRSFTDGF